MNNKYKFVALNETDRPVETFKDAFKCMFNWVQKSLANNELSYQVLETAIWIEMPTGKPMYFYDARDKAIDDGILVDGKLID